MDYLDPLAWNLSIFCFNLNRLETKSNKQEKQNLMILVNIYIKIYFKNKILKNNKNFIHNKNYAKYKLYILLYIFKINFFNLIFELFDLNI